VRYVQPYGDTDPDASYVNGNPATGTQGSIPAAEALEVHQRELVALIKGTNLVPTSDDLQQILKSTRSQYINYVEDEGVVDALSVTFDPAFTELSVGLPIRVKAANTNTGITTIQIDNISPIEIKRGNGASLFAGDIKAGQIVNLIYDGTYFQVENFSGYTSEVINNNTYVVDIPYIADTSGSPNVITAVFSPEITSLGAGDIIEVKIANTNTGNTTIDVNSLPTKEVRSVDLQQLAAGQITAGMMALLKYDGTYFQLTNPVKNRSDATGVHIANRYVYQDTDYHISSTPLYDTEAFRVNYLPDAGDNEIRVTVNGIMDSGSSVGPRIQIRTVRIWLQYSTDAGATWDPPSYPGPHYPTVGSFMATTHLQLHDPTPGDVTRHIILGFRIVGFMTVPSGAPEIIFRIMYAPANTQTTNATVYGGSILEITEFTPGA